MAKRQPKDGGLQVTKGMVKQATKMLAGYGFVPNANKPWHNARWVGLALAPGTHAQQVAMANAIVKVMGTGTAMPGGYNASILHFGQVAQQHYKPFQGNTYKVGNVSCGTLALGCQTHKVYTAKRAVGKCNKDCQYGLVVVDGNRFVHTLLAQGQGAKAQEATPEATPEEATSEAVATQ